MGQLKPMPESSALPVNNYRIVFVHGKRGVDGGIVQVLRSCAGDVDLQPDMVIPDDRACDLLLVDYDNIPPKDKTILVEGFGDLKKKMQLLLISSGKVKDDFPKLFGS